MDWLQDLWKTAAPVLGTAIAGLVVGILTRYLQRLGISLEADEQAKLEHFVKLAILRAEEWANTMAKAGETIPPDQKLIAAENAVLRQFPKADPVKVQNLIHALLPQVRGVLVKT